MYQNETFKHCLKNKERTTHQKVDLYEMLLRFLRRNYFHLRSLECRYRCSQYRAFRFMLGSVALYLDGWRTYSQPCDWSSINCDILKKISSNVFWIWPRGIHPIKRLISKPQSHIALTEHDQTRCNHWDLVFHFGQDPLVLQLTPLTSWWFVNNQCNMC